MQHEIDIESLGPRGEAMIAPIDACVHCGFCLPTCPTYVTDEEEMDSPRGRIFLMKQVLEGQIELDGALGYIDNCLGCQACVTACPSGVQYGDLITAFRAHVEPVRPRDPVAGLRRELALGTLPHPRRFRAAAKLGRPAKALSGVLPDALAPMLELLPDALPRARPLPALYPAVGERRARVALLAGCAQQVLDPDINWATLKVLALNGVETVIPPEQGCCGSLSLHVGKAEQAQALARRNLEAFPRDVDAVITNAAGCGSGMREYGLLFAGTPDAEAAQELAGRVLDVSVFLDQLGLTELPAALEMEVTVAYHDACHLAHAQQVRAQPRRLLAQIPGVSVAEPIEWELCCGSAGIYNVEHPETAAKLGARKAGNLAALDADVIATANIGCMTQLRMHLDALGHATPVLHTMQVLQRAYAGTLLGPDVAR